MKYYVLDEEYDTLILSTEANTKEECILNGISWLIEDWSMEDFYYALNRHKTFEAILNYYNYKISKEDG